MWRQLARREQDLRDITQRAGYRTINKETVVARSRIRYIHFKIKELTGSRCINLSSDGGDSDSSGSRTPNPGPVGPRPPTEPPPPQPPPPPEILMESEGSDEEVQGPVAPWGTRPKPQDHRHLVFTPPLPPPR